MARNSQNGFLKPHNSINIVFSCVAREICDKAEPLKMPDKASDKKVKSAHPSQIFGFDTHGFDEK